MTGKNWTEFLFEAFPDKETAGRVTLVNDPEGLLATASVLDLLGREGCLVVEFSETMLLRAVYERTLRNHPAARLLVLFRNGEDLEAVVPYDLRRQAGPVVDLRVERVFPNFDLETLRCLDRPLFEAFFSKLYLAGYKEYNQEETCEFLLEKVFGLSASAIQDNTDFLEALHRVHFKLGLTCPSVLAYLKREICARMEFPEFQFSRLILSSAEFLAFVQREWNLWMTILKEHGNIKIQPGVKGFPLLDFQQDRVRSVVDEMFHAGLLQGENTIEGLELQLTYLSRGHRPKAGEVLSPFFEACERRVGSLVSHRDWLQFAREWATLEALALKDPRLERRLEEVRNKIDVVFYDWLVHHYANLATIPGMKTPVMVHRTWQILAKEIVAGRKVVLLVVDGLSLRQWEVMKRTLAKDFVYEEGTSFAWLPTLTSVSRQAIFSGKAPFGFASTFLETNAEKKEWTQLWQEAGVEGAKIFYDRNWGVTSTTAAEDLLKIPMSTRVCGVVVNSVDNLMHGETLGAVNFQHQTEAWMAKGYLRKLLKGFCERGFEVFLTNDHGNVSTVGGGKIKDGVLAELKGERVRLYEKEALCKSALDKMPQGHCWTNVGLPENCHVLFAGEGEAFLAKGEPAVTHGGPSLEEVVVPFVRLRRKASLP